MSSANTVTLGQKLSLLAGSLGFRLRQRLGGNVITRSTRRPAQALIPTPEQEAIGKPMDEWMWYVKFDASGDGQIDTFLRYYWVYVPAISLLRLQFLLVSEVLESRMWVQPFFGARVEGTAEGVGMRFDVGQAAFEARGNYREGYHAIVDERQVGVRGEFDYRPRDGGVVFYRGGRYSPMGKALLRAYDVFNLNVDGELTVDGQTMRVKDGRGIVEHATGIFDLSSVHHWDWINLQFDDGALHLFNVVTSDGAVMLEGASNIGGVYQHYLTEDVTLREVDTFETTDPPRSFPARWRIELRPPGGLPLLLDVTSSARLTNANDFVQRDFAYYILSAEGTSGERPVEARGSSEFLDLQVRC